jgi:hypothetical protein
MITWHPVDGRKMVASEVDEFMPFPLVTKYNNISG